MAKTILIPTDFSENAGDALAYALAFVGEEAAHLHIVNVVDVAVVQPDMPIESASLQELFLQQGRDAMQALDAFGQQYLVDNPAANFTLTTDVVLAPVPVGIKAAAKDVDADLIIMGTQGTNHTPLEKRFGTISTFVLKNAPCPVLVVPRGYEFTPIDTILFATNLNHGDPYELWRATELIKPQSGLVRCVHIVKDSEELEEPELAEFSQYMVEHSPTIQTTFDTIVAKNVESSLAESAEHFSAELIIMYRSKRGFWERLFAPRHTKRMVSYLDLPLLVMNQKA